MSMQEIQLRLRTDDLLGFRKYERIRDTLMHELAHNEFGDHDNNFKVGCAGTYHCKQRNESCPTLEPYKSEPAC